jgi:hypothetical protein
VIVRDLYPCAGACAGKVGSVSATTLRRKIRRRTRHFTPTAPSRLEINIFQNAYEYACTMRIEGVQGASLTQWTTAWGNAMAHKSAVQEIKRNSAIDPLRQSATNAIAEDFVHAETAFPEKITQDWGPLQADA